MNNLYLAWIIGLGVWVVCDGLASVWAYHGKERWWRNQSFRALRMLIGVIIITLASLLVRNQMPNKDKKKQLAAWRRWYHSHIGMGLCGKCLNRAFPGLTLCPKHLYENQMNRKRYYQKHRTEMINKTNERSNRLQEEGKCRTCGIKLIEGEGIFCVNCAMIQHTRGVLR